jgi:ABC-type nickel/cobalt efflux system permease component RcnA
MSNSSSSSSSGGIGFVGLLTIVFITLKLTGYIDWSWWWVLSPVLFSIGLVLTILAVAGLVIAARGR